MTPSHAEAPTNDRKWLLALAVVMFVVLTGVSGETECVVDGTCEFGIPLRWMAPGIDLENMAAFVIDLALFLSLVPAALAVRHRRSWVAMGWLIIVGAGLTLFTIVNWSGLFGLRVFLHSLG